MMQTDILVDLIHQNGGGDDAKEYSGRVDR